MAASYPSGTKSFSTKLDGPSNTIFAAHPNEIQDEVVAVENALLTGFAHAIKSQSGTAALPGVGVGAANVGVYSSGANALDLATAGVKALGIDSTQFIDSPTQPRCSVFNSATQSVPNNADTALTFDSETYDVGALHSTASQTSRVTIPTGGDGLYLIIGESYVTGSAVGTRRDLKIFVNNAVVRDVIVAPNANAVKLQITVLHNLVATDYVELFALQDSGGNLNIGNPGNGQDSRLSVVKLW